VPLRSAFRDVTAQYSRVEAWGYDRFVGRRAVQPLLPPLMAAVEPLDAKPSVLDIGCGGGHLLVSLAEQHPAWTLIGVDLSPDQVRRAAQRGSGFGDRFTVVEGSATGLPFPSDSFDAVLSIASIKHWPDRVQGMREAIRLLRPGGRFFIGEVHRGATQGEARVFLSSLGVPAVLLQPACAMFRRFVLAEGWTSSDAEAIATALRLPDYEVECLPSPPLVVLAGVHH
jgi:SAM-dependent methyltransferase